MKFFTMAPVKPALYNNVEDIMKRSVIVEGFEQLHSIPLCHQSQSVLKRQRKVERLKDTGSAWFNLPATKKSDDIKRDLEILKMRSALDPKRFYKRSDLKNLPKYFQVARVVDSPLDYYSGRIPKKQRKRTLVDELMIDAEFKKFNKRKFQEIISTNPKLRKKVLRRAKKLKKK